MTNALIRFDAARVALAEARSIDEVKDIRDKAEALRLYAKQAGESLEMQNDIAEIKLRAERRAGELLKDMADSGERALGRPAKVLQPVTLSEYGIERIQSSRWQAMADVPEETFEQHIATVKARNDELTSAGVLRIAKELKREDVREQNRELVAQAAPLATAIEGMTFPTIVLDPPWDWGDEGDFDQLGRARPIYDTMPIAEIAALPVNELAEPNAHIYLWITNRSLPKGFELLAGWGFRYVTMLTWCKPSIGMGNYYRGSTEHVLFGVRGSLGLLRQDVGTWFAAPRGNRHSMKPDAFYEVVETCSPGPWLEMFARSQRPGWQVWGAEI